VQALEVSVADLKKMVADLTSMMQKLLGDREVGLNPKLIL
jgi:hypothetical protein